MVDAITGATAAPNEGVSISDSTEANKDLFLQLLVAQVRYQNPLEPVDNNEFLAQTAQFTMVEQITKVAEQQAELLAFQRATLAENMVGQVVTGVDQVEGETISGVVDAVEYNLGDPQLVIGSERIGLDEVMSSGTAIVEVDAASEPAGDEPDGDATFVPIGDEAEVEVAPEPSADEPEAEADAQP